MDKKISRVRRAQQTRRKIASQKIDRLTVHRTNSHIYAQVISAAGKVLAATPRLRPSSASASLKKRSPPVSRKSRSTVPVLLTMAASRRWPRPRVKPA
jgi:hypothetical protein